MRKHTGSKKQHQHNRTLRFVSEQASCISPSDHAAFIQETVRAPEAVVVERLQVLLRDGASVVLRGVLEHLPTPKLALILSENDAHRFLCDEAVDTLLEHLSLAEIVELSEAVARDRSNAHAAIFGRPAVLERVRSTLASVVTDRPLPGLEGLLGRSAAALLALAYASSCPVAEQQRLATLLSRLIERGQVRLLASILESVQLPNGTVDLLGDLHLRWLCRHHADLLLKLAADGSRQGFCLARRLVTMQVKQDGEEAAALGGLSTLLEQLDNNQIWDLVCHYVQLHDPSERGRALSTVLAQLDAKRIAGVISERYSDPEIGVYWPLFPEAVRTELIQLGRGRVWSWDESKGARSSQRFGYNSTSSTKGGYRSRRRWRQASRKRAARRGHGPEVVEALSLMVELFGFDESMSFQEAQRRYWRLVMKWHPDRAGNNPVSERKIRDLNRAWDTAKVCFVSNAG